MNEAVDAARALAELPDDFLPDQFSNPANPDIHRRTTGPEILDALDGHVDVLVAGVGTGGTITGAGEAIRAVNAKAQLIAVEPQSSAVLSGRAPGPHRIQGIGAGFVPAVLNRELIDEVIAVPRRGGDRDRAARRGARGRARRALVRRRAVGRDAGRRAPGLAGKRIVCVLPGLGRALRLRAVLRALNACRKRWDSGPQPGDCRCARVSRIALGRRRAVGSREIRGRPQLTRTADPSRRGFVMSTGTTIIWAFRDPTYAQADLTGFKVEATDGSIGKIDESTYEVGSDFFVVDTGPWILGKKVSCRRASLERIDSDAEQIFVDRTKDQIKNAPEFDEANYRDSGYRDKLGSYYS